MDLRYNYILGDSYVYCIYLESYHLWSLGCVQFRKIDSWVIYKIKVQYINYTITKRNGLQISGNFKSKLSSCEFFQKTNKWARFYYYTTCFRSFFGRNWRHPKDISKLPDLYLFKIDLNAVDKIYHIKKQNENKKLL